MKLAEGTISAKGKGLARVTHLLIDEATELPSEEEYLKLVDSFRQKGTERRIFVLFNPTSKNHWLFKRFYLPDGQPNPKWLSTHGYLHTTYMDNKDNLDPTKIAEWEALREEDEDYFAHHILGEWRDIGEGQVFKGWHFDFSPDPEAEVVYGMDWGFASDPTVLLKVRKKSKSLWVEELIYQTGLTNEDVFDRMVKLGIPRDAVIYADSAEPKAIETIRRMGYRNIRATAKGPDSIRAGIDRVRTFQVFVSPESTNLIQEYYNYAYRSGTDKPIDDWNHAMDSLRYAVLMLKAEGRKYGVYSGRQTPSAEFT
jgi:phage terminase large subunit